MWEDNTKGLVDLRHLLMPYDDADGAGSNSRVGSRRLPLAMTQQIEELSSATNNSDDEEGREANVKPMGTADGGGSVRSSDSNESHTPPPPSNPPEPKAGSNRNCRLLHLGEVPATISNLKRRCQRGEDSSKKSARHHGGEEGSGQTAHLLGNIMNKGIYWDKREQINGGKLVTWSEVARGQMASELN